MKDFVRPSGRLRGLPLAARFTYSVFLVFTLLALAFTGWLGADMLGADLSGIGSYYAGAASPPPSAASTPSAADGGGSRTRLQLADQRVRRARAGQQAIAVRGRDHERRAQRARQHVVQTWQE